MDLGKVNIQEVFEQTIQYIIPLFQRHYVWEKEGQWKPLWEDIENKSHKRMNEVRSGRLMHFTGAIVVQSKETNIDEVATYEIIDGQQRLTTFQVIFCAIRDVCNEINTEEFSGIAKEAEKYILNCGFNVHGDGKFKLLPTGYDRPALQAIIDNKDFSSNASKICDAYNYFKEKIGSFIQSDSKKASTLFNTIKGDFGLVQIRVSSEDEPEMIFESLNGRGKPLLQFDLLRNNLFLRTRQSMDEDRDNLYQQYWAHFESGCWEQEVSVGRRKVTFSELFLQHFLSAKLATDNVEPLFRTYQKEYRRTLGENPEVKIELKEMCRYSLEYQKITAPDNEFAIYDFLNITTLRPFILYLMAEVNLSSAQQKYVFKALESYTMRRAFCTTQKHKGYNKFFPELIKKLRKQKFSVHNNIKLMKEETADSHKWPENNEVLNAFQGNWKKMGVNSKVVRHVLYCVEEFMRKNARFNEGGNLPRRESFTLEHILPQQWWEHWLLPYPGGLVKWQDIISEEYKKRNPRWNEEYPQEGQEEYALVDQSYVKSIEVAKERDDLLGSMGNFTLLTRPLNSSASNSPFSDKKGLLKEHSSLYLNKRICDKEDWDIDQIKERTKELCEIFCQIWPDAQWFLDNIPSE